MQYLKSRPQDQAVRSSLQFLLSAMNAVKRKIPLAESFLVQLDVDLEGSGLVTDEGISKFSYGSLQRSPEDDARQSALRVCIPSCQRSYSRKISCTNIGLILQAVRYQFEKCAIGIVDIALLDKDKAQNCSSNLPEPGSSSDPKGVPSQRQSQPGEQRYSAPTQIYGLGMPATIPDLRMPQAQDDQFNFMDFDMDASAGGNSTGSERHLSYSDNPSPITNKASSNSSFSPAHLDHPSPKQNVPNQQQLPQHILSSLSYTASEASGGFGAPMPIKPNTASISATSSRSQLQPQELFTLPDGWDFMQQPSQQAESDLIPPARSPSAMDPVISSLEDIPWSQSPDGFNTGQWTQ